MKLANMMLKVTYILFNKMKMLLYLIHYQLFELLVTTLHLVQKNQVSEFLS